MIPLVTCIIFVVLLFVIAVVVFEVKEARKTTKEGYSSGFVTDEFQQVSGPKVWCFVTSFLLASILAGAPLSILLWFTLLFPAVPLMALQFPLGLIRCFGIDVLSTEVPMLLIAPLCVVLFLMYLTIAYLGVKKKKWLLFFIFVMLLLLNIGGCQILIWSHFNPIPP